MRKGFGGIRCLKQMQVWLCEVPAHDPTQCKHNSVAFSFSSEHWEISCIKLLSKNYSQEPNAPLSTLSSWDNVLLFFLFTVLPAFLLKVFCDLWPFFFYITNLARSFLQCLCLHFPLKNHAMLLHVIHILFHASPFPVSLILFPLLVIFQYLRI